MGEGYPPKYVGGNPPKIGEGILVTHCEPPRPLRPRAHSCPFKPHGAKQRSTWAIYVPLVGSLGDDVATFNGEWL